MENYSRAKKAAIKLPRVGLVMSEVTSTPPGADGETPFELQYFPPDPDLAEMVSSFYFVRIDMPVFDEYERADRPQFRIMSSTAGEYIFPDGHCFPAARATIVGPTSGSVRARATGPLRIYGFGLLPVGWATLMGDHADKLTDRAMDAADLFGNWIDDAVGALT